MFHYLRFVPTGHNLWEVMRRRPKGETVKIGEVVLQANGERRFLALEGHAFSLEETKGITTFMETAHEQRTAFVLPKTGKIFAV